jgi:hypothetical protein
MIIYILNDNIDRHYHLLQQFMHLNLVIGRQYVQLTRFLPAQRLPLANQIIQYHMITKSTSKHFNDVCFNGLAQPRCFVGLLIRTTEKIPLSMYELSTSL